MTVALQGVTQIVNSTIRVYTDGDGVKTYLRRVVFHTAAGEVILKLASSTPAALYANPETLEGVSS